MATFSLDKKYRIQGDAETIGNALEEIRNRNNGVLKPKIVVNESRPENAPLHDNFEWDDEIAGEKFREQQASQIIRAVRVTHGEAQEEKVTRVYVSVDEKPHREGGYYSVTDAMRDSDIRAEVIQKAWNDLIAWKARYLELESHAKMGAIFKTISSYQQEAV